MSGSEGTVIQIEQMRSSGTFSWCKATGGGAGAADAAIMKLCTYEFLRMWRQTPPLPTSPLCPSVFDRPASARTTIYNTDRRQCSHCHNILITCQLRLFSYYYRGASPFLTRPP
eukprot:scaffold17446_cov67-Skeletonema_dohrnii-CCMP3373.AAC.1